MRSPAGPQARPKGAAQDGLRKHNRGPVFANKRSGWVGVRGLMPRTMDGEN